MSEAVPSAVTAQLAQWSQEQRPGRQLGDVWKMPGNAGVSFGFTVTGADSPEESFVVRLAPIGVTVKGNTDVRRQIPLLDKLSGTKVPVARLVWAGTAADVFGTDAIVQEFVKGRPLHMTEPEQSCARSSTDVRPMVQAAVQALANIHATPVDDGLARWAPKRTAEDEVRFWMTLAAKVDDPEASRLSTQAADRLLASLPTGPVIGLVHGDFQTNNILYGQDGELLAIVDWELAGVGPQHLDLAWLSVFSDPMFWAREQQERLLVTVPVSDLVAWYEAATGRVVADFNWFRALAAYRFGVIAAFNLRLHRTGRRPDPAYELIASSIPVLLQRSVELVSRSPCRTLSDDGGTELMRGGRSNGEDMG